MNAESYLGISLSSNSNFSVLILTGFTFNKYERRDIFIFVDLICKLNILYDKFSTLFYLKIHAC